LSSVDPQLEEDDRVKAVWLVAVDDPAAEPPPVTWRCVCGAVAVLTDGDEAPECCAG
jgi:hypothetical protein